MLVYQIREHSRHCKTRSPS